MKIRVTIERSWTKRRYWLKAVDEAGNAEVIQNIPAWDVVTLRNKLLESLTASGKYDEVIGDPIKDFPDASPTPWTIQVKSPANKNKWKRRLELVKRTPRKDETQ